MSAVRRPSGRGLCFGGDRRGVHVGRAGDLLEAEVVVHGAAAAEAGDDRADADRDQHDARRDAGVLEYLRGHERAPDVGRWRRRSRRTLYTPAEMLEPEQRSPEGGGRATPHVTPSPKRSGFVVFPGVTPPIRTTTPASRAGTRGRDPGTRGSRGSAPRRPGSRSPAGSSGPRPSSPSRP